MTSALISRAGSLLLLLVLVQPAVSGTGGIGSSGTPGTEPLFVAGDSDGVLHVEFQNGIAATIYSSVYLDRRIEYMEGAPILVLDDGREFELVTDIEDPAIANKGDGSFHPFRVSHVLEALGEIARAGGDLNVEIYVLPYPRRQQPSSTTSGRSVFLSPQVRELPYGGAAYILTHEIGHVFQNRYLPRSDRIRWDEYRRLRGIEDRTVYNDSAPHAFRPEEILAEDFRVLFGGPAARYDGRVENPLLQSPLQVAGLEDFFVALGSQGPVPRALLEVTNYPNPFNPATEIRITLENGDRASSLSLNIYDSRGKLVWRYASPVAGGEYIRVRWNGRDLAGNPVASGVYFCLVEAGGQRAARKLLLVK